MSLKDLVIQQARLRPESPAVKGPDGMLTYRALDALANRFAHALAQQGVQTGDRVGIWLEKTTYAVAAMQAALRLRAIYVPIDPLSPTARVHTIMHDCRIKALVTTQQRAEGLPQRSPLPEVSLFLDGSGADLHWVDGTKFPDTLPELPTEPHEDEIAYVLYTSGSTGKPKGVCISHRNALAFIEWATSMLEATAHDRLANHAPFHFDLSVLDLYVAFSTGAMVFLIPDGLSYLPGPLVDCVLRQQLTIWYSVPSVLTLMMDQGGLLDMPSLPLRAILFAGEPFPIQSLKKLYQRWPDQRYVNLYGPTETNVCTFYEVSGLPPDNIHLVPIGTACSGDRVWAQKEDGSIAGLGEVGELMVEGPTVMVGYWGEPPHGNRPYATGDLVRRGHDDNYVYLGRRDHMVKVRGYRIELGEIEAILGQHPAVKEIVVIVIGEGLDARLIAFVVAANPAETPTLLDMKRQCAEHLPRYMIVDDIWIVTVLPRTRNGKIDRSSLAAAATSSQR